MTTPEEEAKIKAYQAKQEAENPTLALDKMLKEGASAYQAAQFAEQHNIDLNAVDPNSSVGQSLAKLGAETVASEVQGVRETMPASTPSEKLAVAKPDKPGGQVATIDGKQYYLPDSTMYQMGYRTPEEYAKTGAVEEGKASGGRGPKAVAPHVTIGDKQITRAQAEILAGLEGSKEARVYEKLGLVDTSTIKKENPELYDILISKGFKEYNKAIEVKNKEILAEKQQFEKQSTKLPDGQWISNTDLENMKTADPKVYDLLITKGFDAANNYITEYNKNIESGVRAQATLAESSYLGQMPAVDFSSIKSLNDLPVGATNIKYTANFVNKKEPDIRNTYTVTYNLGSFTVDIDGKTHVINKTYTLIGVPSLGEFSLEKVTQRLESQNAWQKAADNTLKIISSKEFLLAQAAVGGALSEGVQLGSQAVSKIIAVLNKIPKPYVVGASIGISGLNGYSTVVNWESETPSERIGSIGFTILPLIPLAIEAAPSMAKIVENVKENLKIPAAQAKSFANELVKNEGGYLRYGIDALERRMNLELTTEEKTNLNKLISKKLTTGLDEAETNQLDGLLGRGIGQYSDTLSTKDMAEIKLLTSGRDISKYNFELQQQIADKATIPSKELMELPKESNDFGYLTTDEMKRMYIEAKSNDAVFIEKAGKLNAERSQALQDRLIQLHEETLAKQLAANEKMQNYLIKSYLKSLGSAKAKQLQEYFNHKVTEEERLWKLQQKAFIEQLRTQDEIKAATKWYNELHAESSRRAYEEYISRTNVHVTNEQREQKAFAQLKSMENKENEREIADLLAKMAPSQALKVFTEAQPVTKTASMAKAKIQPATLPQTETKLSTQTKTQTATQTKTQTEPLTEVTTTKIPAPGTTSLTPTPPTPKKPQPSKVPPPPPKISLPGGEEEAKWTPEEIKSAIAWKDGFEVHAIKSPYRRGIDEQSFHIDHIPPGIRVLDIKGRGSQQASARVIGKFPRKLTVDVGFIDIVISKGHGKNVIMRHSKDTRGTISQTTISKKRGRVYHTATSGGNIISRRPLRGY